MKAGRKVLAFAAGVSLAAAVGCVSAKTHRQALEAEQQATQAATDQANEAKASLAKAQAEVKSLSEAKAVLEDQLKKAQTAAAASKSAAEARSAEVAKLTDQVSSLKAELAAATDKVKALSAEVEKLKKPAEPAGE